MWSKRLYFGSTFLGETEFHHLCVFIGQKGIPDNLPDSWIHQGRQDLSEKGRGPEGMVLFTEGGRRETRGTNFRVTKNSPFQFHVDQKKPPFHPSYSFLPETKMTGAMAGGKKRSSKNAMASEEIVMMMMIMTLLQMLMMRVQTTLSGTQCRAPVPRPQMCQRASTDYHVSTELGLRNTVVITTLSISLKLSLCSLPSNK